MKKGVKTRLSAFNILYSIFIKNNNYDNAIYQECFHKNFSSADREMISSIVLNSMRYYFHIKKFLLKYIKQNCKKKQFLLLITSSVQIVYLLYIR